VAVTRQLRLSERTMMPSVVHCFSGATPGMPPSIVRRHSPLRAEQHLSHHS
jgi:hypothetical protein